MRQSQLFTKTRKEAPSDESALNAKLLIRAGYVHKEMAGVYAFLPLGLRVLNKVKQIVREEMDNIGGQELFMTTLQRKELWEKTTRWDDKIVDVWFKSELKSGGEVGFAWSHEEPITDMMRSFISSFRDLPIFVYQFQNKLRNELRAKSGLMRGREFGMKDMYSYCLNEEDHTKFYNQAIESYKKVYDRLGIGEDTYITFASGGAFTEFSHEFQTVIENGEDTIFINKGKGIAINAEILNEETLKNLNISREELTEVKTSEVGNIFNFGVKKSEELGLSYMGEDGKKVPVWLGSYGIGITRLIGLIVEKFSDSKGIIWPENIAPFELHLLSLDLDTRPDADTLYEKLVREGREVLYDDRDVGAGEKFADSDLIGIPTRVVVSKKAKAAGGFEIKKRKKEKVSITTDV